MLKRADPSTRSPRSGPRPQRGMWLAMFGVALLLRVGYAWLAAGPNSRPFSDPADYDTVAWNLVRGLGFALDAPAGPYPTAFVPPVVPWVTSLLYHVVGHDYFAAVLLQCLVGALVPLALAAFATAMFGGNV